MFDSDKCFHQVGLFVAHFKADFENISAALQNAGYSICQTLNGDVAIMAEGQYDAMDLMELNGFGYHDHDDDDDDEDGDDDRHITPYNRNY